MNKKVVKKRSHILSIGVLAVCCAALVGATFAWFTDTASTGTNKIQAGNLDIELLGYDQTGNAESIEGKTIKVWQNNALVDLNDSIKWEPGATFQLQSVEIKNAGNLAVKYKVVINGAAAPTSGADLASVIDVYLGDKNVGTLRSLINDNDGIAYGNLVAGGTTGSLVIKLHMQEAAGNEYKDATLGTDGFSITVYATQDAAEYDSISNQYDANAELPTQVATVTELQAALADTSVKLVTLTSDITLADTSLSIEGEKTIDLNGKTISAPASGALTGEGSVSTDAIFTVKRGGTLTINGTGTVTSNGNTAIYSAIKLTAKGEAATGDAAKLVINGGTFIGEYYAICGNGDRDNTDVTINGGTFKATHANDNLAIYHPQDGTLTINGGTFEGYNSAIEMRAGTLNINGGTFTSTATTFSCTPNRSGTTTVGAALAIAQHTSGEAINVTITAGTFTAGTTYGIVVANPQNNDTNNVTVSAASYSVLVKQAAGAKGSCTITDSTRTTATVVNFAS